MSKVRYAVVGAGWISQIAFLPSIPQTSNSTVSAIVSGNQEGSRKLAEFYGIPHVGGYDHYDDMLAQDLFDAVYIALPNSMHMDYTVRAAQAGKHVLVEKPLAITGEECQTMIDAAEKSGVNLMTAYRLHHDPATVEIFDKIHSGAIGEPRAFLSAFSFQAVAGNHRLLAEHWGGPLQDIGVYCLNCARSVFNTEPIEVSAFSTSTKGDARFSEIAEVVSVTLRFEGERMAQFTVSFGAGSIDSYQVIGSKGVIHVDPGYRFETDVAYRMVTDDAESFASTPVPCDHFGSQAEYFSDCILRGEKTWLDPSEGMADVVIMRAIEKAAETGQTQKIALPPKRTRPTRQTARQIERTDRRLML